MLYIKVGNETYRVDRAQNCKLAIDALEQAGLDSAPILASSGAEVEPTGDDFCPDDYGVKVLALAEALDISPMSNIGYDGRSESDPHAHWTSDDAPGEYLVLDDSERETMWDEALESYIDDCILDQLPKAYRNYFDCESWKSDARISDGAGHCLASYDGNEHEVMINGEWYYIYRVG